MYPIRSNPVYQVKPMDLLHAEAGISTTCLLQCCSHVSVLLVLLSCVHTCKEAGIQGYEGRCLCIHSLKLHDVPSYHRGKVRQRVTLHLCACLQNHLPTRVARVLPV